MKLTAFLCCVFITQAYSFGCLDNSGKTVDWHFTYKFPNASNPDTAGFDISYTDANSGDQKTLTEYERKLNDKDSPVALIRTLLALEKESSSTSYFLYNDEPSDGSKPGSNYGHTKGVLAIGKDGGFWVIHSTPKWPLSTTVKKFYFPESEVEYGQTFICMTLKKSEIDTVAKQLLYNTPFVYHSTITAADRKAHPAVGQVLDKEWVSDAGVNVATIGASTKFTSFAKNGAADTDLWGDQIAVHYKADLMVESWIRGSALGSYCRPKHKYEVVDVQSMVVPVSKTQNDTWTESQDHAKWGVTLDSSGVLCVGDINRMSTQRARGGGAVCFKHSSLNNQLYNTIVTSATCKSTNRRRRNSTHRLRGGQ